MKYINIDLQPSEAERIKPQVLRMMENITPIIFRDRYNRMFVIIHGLKNRGFNGYTEETLREYVESHSNLKPEEQLYIISCFSATNKLKSSINKMYVETEYPVFIGGINIADENEIPIFARVLAVALSITESEATAIINGED